MSRRISQDMGALFRRPDKSGTRDFCGGIKEIKDTPSALTWQGKAMFTPPKS